VLAARPTLLLAAALVLAAAAFDSASLYVPGIALALLVAGSALWVGLAARRVRIERPPGPWTIVEGDPYPLEVGISAGRLPLPGGRVVHPLAERPAPIAPRSPGQARLRLSSLRRGRQAIEPVRLLLADPLGLRTVELRGGDADQVLVLPRIEPVVVQRPGAVGKGEGLLDGADGLGAGGLDTRPIDFEIDGLRPHREGSPASRIHWPTVARSREMVEHRLVSGAEVTPLVVLDAANAAGDEALDRAVRAAASLCVHLAPSGGCTLQISGERAPREIDPHLRAWPKVHARLAAVEAGGPAPTSRRPPGADAVFWVTAAAELPGGVRALSGGVSYLVTTFALPGVQPVFTVAGCYWQRLAAVRRLRCRLRPRRDMRGSVRPAIPGAAGGLCPAGTRAGLVRRPTQLKQIRHRRSANKRGVP